MNEKPIDKACTFLTLPLHENEDLEAEYRQALQSLQGKIVVLDDDPTGTQTVHDVYVYTDWSVETLKQAFGEENRMVFILTNSRGLTEAETEALHCQIGENLAAVSRQLHMPFLLISRGDSTLRGHYPLETQTLRQTLERQLGLQYDGEVILPFFPEGGRFTIDGIHYVEEDGQLVPAAATEFAKDKTFGFSASRLTEWVEEKTKGAFRSEAVCRISLQELRRDDLNAVTERLCQITEFGKIVVDAVDYEDLKAFVTALAAAANRGKRFLFRTAAAFPKVLGGISDKPLLTKEELCDPNVKQGGLVIAGSHVQKTTVQLAYLMKVRQACPVEFNQHLVMEEAELEKELCRVVKAVEEILRGGETAVVFTRRSRLDVNGSPEAELRLAVRISDAVTSIVKRLAVRPAWIIAKGGITSSEIGVHGLGVRRARVLGQALPGVPVWQTGEESRFPGLSYVIFPGNVGSETAIKNLVQTLIR